MVLRQQAFAPIVNNQATTLILGSMPSVASLQAQQYYAHPRNAFWPIIAALTGHKVLMPEWPYAQRVQALQSAQLALWDVLLSCQRQGSLDSAIVDATSIANDFSGFFQRYPAIKRVFFNGAKAEQCFQRQVLSQHVLPPDLVFQRLPSTSPAHAGMSLATKIMYWQQAIIPHSAT